MAVELTMSPMEKSSRDVGDSEVITITKKTVVDGVRRTSSEPRIGLEPSTTGVVRPPLVAGGWTCAWLRPMPHQTAVQPLWCAKEQHKHRKNVEPCLAASKRGSFVVCCENEETASPSAPDLDSSARGSYVVGCDENSCSDYIAAATRYCLVLVLCRVL